MSLYETQFQSALFLLIIAVADLGFLRGGRANSQGAGTPTYDFAKFSQKTA